MKRILLLIYILFSITLLFYVALPNFDFPKPPSDSVQSNEPADTETPVRRAYFTNFTRAEVLTWYESQLKNSSFQNLPLPTYLLNYPPENSGTIIRDQTKSTFLQEIVHPFRETVFINGYEPKPNDDTNRIVINGVHWRQKIIIRYIPTNTLLRLVISGITIICIPILWLAFVPEFIFLKKVLKSRNIESRE
jgi:hypothetical protein